MFDQIFEKIPEQMANWQKQCYSVKKVHIFEREEAFVSFIEKNTTPMPLNIFAFENKIYVIETITKYKK